MSALSLTLLLVLLGPADAARHPADGRAGRIAYLQEALVAVRQAPPGRLESAYRYVSVRQRNACTSAFERLRVSCLIEVARRSCRARRGDGRAACHLYADVIAVNILGESEFLSVAQRYGIMSRHQNFRQELRRALRRIYGSLATELRLSRHYACTPGDTACLAQAIDAYCTERADLERTGWQYCSSALVWFIGTTAAAP